MVGPSGTCIVTTAPTISIVQVLFLLLNTLILFLFLKFEIHDELSPFSEIVASDCFGLIVLVCSISMSLIDAGRVGS